MSILPRIVVVLTVCAVSAASPSAAAAQENGSLPVPAVEVSAGYTLLHDVTSDVDYPAGWYLSAAGNINRWLAVVGETSGAYRSEDTTHLEGAVGLSEKRRVYTFLAGPRFFHKTGRIVPFAQVLAGLAHRRLQQTETRMVSGPQGQPAGVDTWSPSTSDFALQSGGGIAVYLTERIGLHASADYRWIWDTDEEEVFNELRFLTGFRLHWGSR